MPKNQNCIIQKPQIKWPKGLKSTVTFTPFGLICLLHVVCNRLVQEDDDEVSDVGKEQPSCSGQDDAIDGAILVCISC